MENSSNDKGLGLPPLGSGSPLQVLAEDGSGLYAAIAKPLTREAHRIDLDKEVLEFRPLPGDFYGDVLRYADGRWIPDDGEYDIAFIPSEKGHPNICLHASVAGSKNKRWSWLTPGKHWSGYESMHPRGNAWHYMLAEGASHMGGPRGRFEKHPNERAGDEGMSKVCSMRGASSGRIIELQPTCKHIQAGLVRIRGTRDVVIPPKQLICIYCGEVPSTSNP